MEQADDTLLVHGESGDELRTLRVDAMIVATGLKPDTRFLAEVRTDQQRHRLGGGKADQVIQHQAGCGGSTVTPMRSVSRTSAASCAADHPLVPAGR